MENIQRINGEKYHLNRLSDQELEHMRGYIIADVSQRLHEIEVLETEIARRRPMTELVMQHSLFYEPIQIERTPLAQTDFEAHRIDL